MFFFVYAKIQLIYCCKNKRNRDLIYIITPSDCTCANRFLHSVIRFNVALVYLKKRNEAVVMDYIKTLKNGLCQTGCTVTKCCIPFICGKKGQNLLIFFSPQTEAIKPLKGKDDFKCVAVYVYSDGNLKLKFKKCDETTRYICQKDKGL